MPINRQRGPAASVEDLERVAPALLAHRRDAEPPIDWALIEERLGFGLPSDYREFVRRYPSVDFDDFLTVGGPRPGAEDGFVRSVLENMELVRDLAEEDPELEDGERPGPAVMWGGSSSGDMFLWHVTGPEPDAWPALVFTRNSDWWEYTGGMLGLLAGLIDGSVECWGLPSKPGPNPTVR